MTLDVRTIVVLLIVSSVLMTITLAVGIRTGRGQGLAKWNLGLGLYALAFILIAVRGTLPPLLTMAGADALLLAGLCLQLGAVIELGQASAPRWLLYAPGPLLFAAVAPLMDNYPVFTFVASLSYTCAMTGIAAAAVRLGNPAGPVRWLLAASYAAGGAILALRAGLTLLDPAGQAGLFAPGLLHAVSFIAIFVVIAIGSISFLLMLRERAEAQIRRLAMFDTLTGLYNRGAFMDLAERELARSRRAGTPLAVLMLDLDYFKRVNDDFGHQAGDRVLAEFAAVAKGCLRAGDLLGRYGGEEFCAVLPGAERPTMLAIAERIRLAACARPLGGLPRPTTISVGAALCGPGAQCVLDSAIARADEALYQAKNAGRNRVAALTLDSGKPGLAHVPAPKRKVA